MGKGTKREEGKGVEDGSAVWGAGEGHAWEEGQGRVRKAEGQEGKANGLFRRGQGRSREELGGAGGREGEGEGAEVVAGKAEGCGVYVFVWGVV